MSDNSFPTMASGTANPKSVTRPPIAILLFLILAIMVPIEFSVYAGPLFLTASRVYLLILALLILPHLGKLKLRAFDWFFIAHVLWTCTAYLIIYPPGQAVEMAGSYALEFLVTYLAARIYLRHIEQLKAVIIVVFLMVCISGALAFPEALTGKRYIHDLGRSLTGFSYRFDSEIRMGIFRSHSFFEHPILYGVFCASSLSLIWFVSTPSQRIYRTPLIIFATWLSASSAPILTLIVQVGLLIAERFTRTIKRRDKALAWSAAGIVILAETATGRGVAGLIAMMTLNPATAYARLYQWNFAIDDVLRNPFFGFIPETYTRPSWMHPSIDNWWLLIMMRAGIPSLIFLTLSALLIWLALTRREGPPLFRHLRTGWGMTMIALILGATTVTFFGKLQPLFAFYMGLGAALAACELPSQGNSAPQAPTGRQGPRYTRFANRTQPPAPQGAPGRTPDSAPDRPPVRFRRDHRK